MRYKKGDKIAYFIGTKIVEDEVMLVVDDYPGRPYYHTLNDEKLGNIDIIGEILDNGTRIINPDYKLYQEYQRVWIKLGEVDRWVLNENN